MPKFKDLTNERFGKLIVLEISGKDIENKYLWKCICDCGNTTIVRRSTLKAGQVKSCGCLQSENAKIQLKNIDNSTHGMTNTVTYICWKNMKARCDDPKHQAYKDYGARGISYDNRWKLFENFLEDMG